MKIAVIALLLCMLLPVGALAQLGTANLSSIKGDVQIYTEDTEEWVAASINMPVQEGDRLWVPEGARAEVHIRGGVYVRLDSATAFDILEMQEESYRFFLNGGHAYINNRKGGVGQIHVDTPLSSVECPDNSLVMIDVAEDEATDVAVLKGTATAETPGGTAIVDSGNALHIGSDLAADISHLASPDEWERWNRERDRKIAAATRSQRHIPDELEDYAYQFDNYGKWVHVADYGYCWTPASVGIGWSPYQSGRWTWIRGQYVWISHDPWGWVPHHYGRWTFVARFGWCWVPPGRGSVFWSPGYVGWVHNPSYVAWVPLAPGEIYYGRGYFGPNSVNVTTATIDARVGRSFRNVRFRNGVTVVDRNAFASGRRHIVRGVADPFRAANAEIGPPPFRPGRLGTRPIIKEIPATRRPPERVQRISVQELRQERTKGHFRKHEPGRDERHDRGIPVRRESEPQNVIREQHPAAPPAKTPTRIETSPRDRGTPPDRTGRVPRRSRESAAPSPTHPAQSGAQPAQPHVQPPRPAVPPPVVTTPTQPAGQPQREPRSQESAPGRRFRGSRHEAPPAPDKVAPETSRQTAPQPASPPVPPSHVRPPQQAPAPRIEVPAPSRPQQQDQGEQPGSRATVPRRSGPGER